MTLEHVCFALVVIAAVLLVAGLLRDGCRGGKPCLCLALGSGALSLIVVALVVGRAG